MPPPPARPPAPRPSPYLTTREAAAYNRRRPAQTADEHRVRAVGRRAGTGTLMSVREELERFLGGDAITSAHMEGLPLTSPLRFLFGRCYPWGAVKVGRIPMAGGQAEWLARGQGLDLPFGIVATSGVVYWTNEGAGTVVRLARSGGLPTMLASDEGGPAGIYLSGERMYWTNMRSGEVRMCKLPTCRSPVTLATGQLQPIYIDAMSPSYVFWANMGTSQSSTDGSVMAVAR